MQRWPMTEACTEVLAEMTVCELMSVLLLILHVLQGRMSRVRI